MTNKCIGFLDQMLVVHIKKIWLVVYTGIIIKLANLYQHTNALVEL